MAAILIIVICFVQIGLTQLILKRRPLEPQNILMYGSCSLCVYKRLLLILK